MNNKTIIDKSHPVIDSDTIKHFKKRLLIYAHYYIPDTASTGQLLCELSERLLEQFDITVLCVVPSYLGKIERKYQTQRYYEETINGVKVLRIRVPEFYKKNKLSRIKNILAYFGGAILATFKVGKMDFVFSISQPPILGGLLGVWGKWVKHAKFIYNIQDFNPEQIMAVNYTKNRLLLKIMMLIDKFSCQQSDLIITVGRDLVETIHKRFKNKNIPKTVMINNWVNEKEIYPLASDDVKIVSFKRQYHLENKFVIMYSGNIGLYYDLENLLKIIEKFKPGTKTPDGREVIFAFVGDGCLCDTLIAYKDKHHMENVVFIPYQKKGELNYSLNAADVHWCVNSQGIKGVSCPSKYYGISAAAKSVLAVLENGTEIRCIIEQTKSGLCSSPSDYKSLEQNIRWFIENANTEKITEMGKRSRKNLLENLTMEASIKKYAKEILKL